MKLSIINAGAIQILPWTDDTEDYDPWITADQADKVAHDSQIRISSNKELSLIALNERGDVVGAIWSTLERDDDQDAMVYDFDVAVDPKHRSGQTMIGIRLINSALEDFESIKSDDPRTYIRVCVINSRLADILERRYGFDVESEHRDRKYMTHYGN